MTTYKVVVHKQEFEVEAEDEEGAFAEAVGLLDSNHADIIPLCGNCSRPATYEAGGISRCDRCKDL